MTDDGLLAEQVDYYRARAGEYDQWWRREGRYAKGEEFERAWHAEVADAAAWLADFGPTGHVLELAAGTGNWTLELACHAERTTAVDASPETIEINRRKLADARDRGTARAEVDYVVADLFRWEPPTRFDNVFFSFWLSHVPDARLPGFFELVDRALAPGGRVAVVDNRSGPEGEPNVVEAPGDTPDVADGPGGLSVRELNDGRTFTIVKVYRSPERLAELLGPLGWTVTGYDTERFFTCAALERTATPPRARRGSFG